MLSFFIFFHLLSLSFDSFPLHPTCQSSGRRWGLFNPLKINCFSDIENFTEWHHRNGTGGRKCRRKIESLKKALNIRDVMDA